MNAEQTVETNQVSPELQALRARIDRSVRVPVLYFLTTAVAWLVFSVLLGFLASMKACNPGFLDFDCLSFLHYGRLQPAFMNALIYGWGIQAGIGVMIWIMARLCRAELPNGKILFGAGMLWNTGVTLGVVSILWGGSTSVEWLEFPRWVWPFLMVAYLFLTVWVVILFKTRTVENVYVSVWYFLGACFWFPWIYGTANLLIHHFQGAAVFASATDSWYTTNLILLYFVPVGLGSVYYLLPKVLGRPVHSYQLALIGFWMLAALSGWTGMQKLVGGPIPAWMPAVSAAATVLLLVPVGVVALNHHLTSGGFAALVGSSPTIRFSVFGAMAYTAMSLVLAGMSVLSVSRLTQFTFAGAGFNSLAIYAFFSMCMFGAIYFILPRVSGCEWPFAKLIQIHFWFSVYGTIALVACLFIAGFSQGFSIQNPENWDLSFRGPAEKATAWVRGTSIAWAFLFVANLAFFFQVVLMALRLGRRTSGSPTLFPAGGAH
jgi:cytochrome c oxidase cbb3-type subunit 1